LATGGRKGPNPWCLSPKTAYMSATAKLRTATGGKVIVVITNREDTASKMRQEMVIETAQKVMSSFWARGSAANTIEQTSKHSRDLPKRMADDSFCSVRSGKKYWLQASFTEPLQAAEFIPRVLAFLLLCAAPGFVQNPTLNLDWS